MLASLFGCSSSSGGTAATGGSAGTLGGAANGSGGSLSGGSSSTSGGNAGGATGLGGASVGGANSAGASGAPDGVFIVVDQFGYLPDAEKIAVIRDPETGFDSAQSFTPGSNYAVVNSTGMTVFSGAPTPWNAGAVDPSSGDRAYWFDFSSVTTPGDYYVLDVERGARSFSFRIADDVYKDVLKQALRVFFYQRVGQAKDAAHAGEGWTDAASHVGALLDHQCRRFDDKGNAATERDLWGGWYDAGDYNKYTSWTASYVENLLRAYVQNPAAWDDAANIPESGNGIPDVIDEAKWGMDYLTRLQNEDGSLLSIVGESDASPPSKASGQSLYGTPNTSGTLAGAAAFAYGAIVFRALPQTGLKDYADDLLARAKRAYAWADANPSVVFKNNDEASGSKGLGSGQQEVDDYGRIALKLDAASQLFRATGDAAYRTYFDQNYTKAHLFAFSNYVAPWDMGSQGALLDYTTAAGATESVVTAIRTAYTAGVKSSGNLPAALSGAQDPYLSYMKDYTWGSNSVKSLTADSFLDGVAAGLDGLSADDVKRAAARYVHYLHGVNPLSLVYLSNMGKFGAENSIREFFHTWFADKSPAWDRAGVSTYGPPPGYLTGGPNPSYDIDACCPNNCGSASNNAMCGSEPVSPPKGQPAQKSYKDFNTSWPINSWAVSEPSCGYQVAYLRLLSKFVH